MVPLHGRPLLEWQVEAARAAGAERIVVVTGDEAEKIDLPGVIRVHNERYSETNMVASLMTARGYFGDGFVLAYSDIVYEPHVLESVMHSPASVACAVDHSWRCYWEARFEDPLDDAETLRLRGHRICEIGQPPASLDDIEGQFVGLVGFRPQGIAELETIVGSAYALAAADQCLDGCPRLADQLYTTDILQALITRGHSPVEVPIEGDWLEIDDLNDHALAERMSAPGPTLLEIDREAYTAELSAR